ncbi:MAG: SpoIID/LytB domain-containing protein [Sporolactobacillus sp.]
MKRMLSTIIIILALLFVTGLNTSFAADATNVPQQHLSPDQNGYVGALNNRPSNAPSDKERENQSITPLSVGYWYQHEPSTIRVYMRSQNVVENHKFSTYLRDVLPNEWVASWDSDALKAGVISVRSYGWYCTNHPKYANWGADVDNTTASQVFKDGSHKASTDSAIDATNGEALIYGSTEIPGFYKAGSYGSARESSSYNFYNNAYQNGEHYYANQGKSYRWMLSYYYPSTSVITGNGY